MNRFTARILLTWLALSASGPGAAPADASTPASTRERVEVAENQAGFVLRESRQPFVPWGFNYDHDHQGRLIEDYWDDEWPLVESAFRDMKRLGANVVRIHLQFGKFMDSPSEPNAGSLAQLTRLIRLAEQTGLYLNLTGLGCYHKADVPPWYDALDEPRRWAAQAVFWAAVAKVGAGNPAIFCYDLMNEPVVPGGNQRRDDWLGPGFGDKHFVQWISLDRAGRERHDIARAWIGTLVAAIRQHDPEALITVGLVPWSLDRPGLTSGFAPDKISAELDFIAVHLYPERGQVDEAIETLRGFAAVGKPVVIEELFPLKCDLDELADFVERSREHASGWFGFFWGQTPEQLTPPATIGEAILSRWLNWFRDHSPESRD